MAKSDPTRRAIFSAVGAAVVLPTLSARAFENVDARDHADRELLLLGDELQACRANEKAAWEAQDPAEATGPAVASAITASSLVAERIVGARATTFDGLRVKAWAAFWAMKNPVAALPAPGYQPPEYSAMFSIVADLLEGWTA